MDGFDLLAALIVALLASYFTHLFAVRQDQVKDVQKNIREIERILAI